MSTDALIHTRVMNMPYTATPPPYAADISLAWAVVEKMEASAEAAQFYLSQMYTGDWVARFKGNGSRQYEGEAYADTAAEAICLAALQAKVMVP